ncbi:MAG: hypothetical protein JWR02_861 [Mucilaginibacter sp.]|nr:hypothetical protein [Mucilaginibacter sp.]
MGLPYDLSLSHHQLLFIAFIMFYATNMEIVFTKTKQNDIFTWVIDSAGNFHSINLNQYNH